MYNKIASLKLESFFKHLRPTRTASIGYFQDVITDEDAKASASMVHEMLQLPKYDPIRNSLRGSSGVVNFVTNGEYEPLVELLLKSAFPPNNNDIYHMGNEVAVPDDYFVDAKSYFGASQGRREANENALASMEKLLMGSPKKMTKKWLQEHHITDDVLRERYGAEGLTVFKESLEEYETGLRELKDSSLRKEVLTLYRKLKEDAEKRAANAANPDAPEQPVLDRDEVQRMREELISKRTFLKEKADALHNGFPELNIVDSHSRQIARNEDGFVNWNPLSEIRLANNALLEAHDKTPEEIDRSISVLLQRLQDYRTTDPSLGKIRTQLINFFKVDDPVVKWMNHYGSYARLINEFFSRASQHGKVMILTNVESSALVTPPSSQEKGGAYYWQGGGVMEGFQAANTANYTRDRSEGRNLRGKRTIILVSNNKIDNLPYATTVEMKVSPVDPKEAEIIVRHMLQPYANEASIAAELKLLSDIEKKYENSQGRNAEAEKEQEMAGIQGILESRKDSLGRITPEAQKGMEEMIVGLGQRVAITRIKDVLAANAKYERDEDGNLISVSLDEAAISNTLTEKVNEESTANALGISLRKAKVKFSNYEYKRGSEWGSLVGDHWLRKNDMSRVEREIMSARKEISDIDVKLLSPRLSPATKQEYMKARAGWVEELKGLYYSKEQVMKDLPHYVILWGKPGVGKSVWADAIGDLLKIPIRWVRIGSIKDKWVGNTEKYSEQLINAIFGTINSVYLVDELDRMLEMQEGSGGIGRGQQSHETTESIVADFLNAFEERLQELIEKNVYVIITTNNLARIDTAMMERTRGDVYHVEAANTPEACLRYLWNFLETERERNPKDPWIKNGKNDEESWENTFQAVRSLDLNKISQVMATRELSFRNIAGMFRQMCRCHNSFLISSKAFANGEIDQIQGMPMTTENAIRAASISVDSSNGNENFDFGVGKIRVETEVLANEALKKDKPQVQEVADPVTGKKSKQVVIPPSVIAIMSGEVQASKEEEGDQFEVVETEITDPNDPTRKRKRVDLPTGKTMKELQDSGMVEQPLVEPETSKKQPAPGVPQEKAGKGQETGEKVRKEKVKSSTDYYLSFLEKKGLVENNKLVSQVQQPQMGQAGQAEAPKTEFDKLEKNGVYYFNKQQIMIAPCDVGLEPQRPKGL